MAGAGGGVVAGAVEAALGAVLVGAMVVGCGGEAADGLVAAVLVPCRGGEFGVGEAGGPGDGAA